MLTKEDIKRINEQLKKAAKAPVTLQPGCVCVAVSDPVLGPDKLMITTNPRCVHHGWLPVEDYDEWQPTA